jgi:hypothetical protein
MKLPIAFILLLISYLPVSAGKPSIIIRPGFAQDGVTAAWKEALKTRLPKALIDSMAAIQQPLTPEEQGWFQLITNQAARWNGFRDSLGRLFPGIGLPDTVEVLTGLRGYDDGFTFGDHTVCFDLTAFYRAYGKATELKNSNRIDRIFAHEYTHLLHKAWAAKHALHLTNFKDSILWECLYEGVGAYRSLNARWLPVKGVLPGVTVAALEELYPVFVDRLTTIATAASLTGAQKDSLNSQLSRGAINKKWGAFPVGIWLALEAQQDERHITTLINQGPEAVLQLARKYLPAQYRSRFEQVFKN